MSSDLIPILIKQHKKLKKELLQIVILLRDKSNVDIDLIRSEMETFQKDIIAHLRLENRVFYVLLLDKMQKQNKNIVKTQAFISEMNAIETEVLSFLEKYKTDQQIIHDIDVFEVELQDIIDVLVLRIQSEEEGVYQYFMNL